MNSLKNIGERQDIEVQKLNFTIEQMQEEMSDLRY